MKMRNAAMAMTMAAMVALSACGGSSKPAETQAAAASEAAGAAAEAAGELKEITAGMLEGPVILTSVGQSADVDIVNTLCTKAGIDLEKNNGITADDLPADCRHRPHEWRKLHTYRLQCTLRRHLRRRRLHH